MPTVPYNPVPTVSPDSTPVQYRTTAGVSETAFGANIGEAMQRFGGAAEKVGDVLEKSALSQQDLANRAAVDKADAQFMVDAGAEHAKFGAMQGAAAADYYPTYTKNLQDIRERVRQTLPNPATEKMYDSQSRRTLSQTIYNGAGHAATEQHKDAIESINGRIVAATALAASLRDPTAVNQVKEKIAALVRVRDHDLKGMTAPEDQEAVEGAVRLATSKLDRDWLEHQMDIDVPKAKEEFEKRRAGGKMTEEDQRHIQDRLDTKENSVGARGIVDATIRDNEVEGELKASYKQLEQQVVKKAEALSDNPAVKQNAVSQLRAEYNRRKYSDVQEKGESMQVIGDLVEAGAKSSADVMADPKGAAAVMNLKPSERLLLDKKIATWVASRDKVHNEGMMRQLDGMRTSSKEEFLNLDPYDENLNLSQANIKTIRAQQRQDLKARPQDDPRPWRAMTQLRADMGPQLQALGLYKRAGNEDAFDHFMGTLSTALDSWQETHGDRPPSAKDIKETIGPSVLRQITVPGRFWGTNTETFFQQAPSDSFSKSYLRDNPNADSEEIQREFNRGRLLKLYQTTPGSRAKDFGDRWQVKSSVAPAPEVPASR
jgi:hypothetical protein